MSITIGMLEDFANEIMDQTADMCCSSKDGITLEVFDDALSVKYQDNLMYYVHRKYGQIDLDMECIGLVYMVLNHVNNKLLLRAVA